MNTLLKVVFLKKENRSVKKVLLTGGRTFITLELARVLSNDNIEVYVADSHRIFLTKYSKCVKKSFLCEEPKYNPEKFIKSLEKIIVENKIDLVIPIFEEIMYISYGLDVLKKHAEILCMPFDVMDSLHNKDLFYLEQKKQNIKTLDSKIIRNLESLEKFANVAKFPIILKKVYSRASQDVMKIDTYNELLSKNINFDMDFCNPWIYQKYLDGNKYCSYSLCDSGKVIGHIAYPVEYTVDGHSCIAYRSIYHKKIEKWVENFVKNLNFTINDIRKPTNLLVG
jgi:hypothetical protein